ncbi:MAG: 2-isopropylmalate synthase [Alphaproteobacteria bacterium ADurb.Bin438]|nr:MAG: 2-isopropylmalate synthase [Alphaproteobacteria bacterium ADurb.Bin438]
MLKALDKVGFDFIEVGFHNHDYSLFDKPPFFENSQMIMSTNAMRVDYEFSESKDFKKLVMNEARIACFDIDCLNDFDENVSKIKETLKYVDPLLRHTNIEFLNFFEAYNKNSEKMVEILKIALKNGAKWVVLSDNDYKILPEQLEKTITAIKTQVDIKNIGINCHNKFGYAIDNSLMAIKCGVSYLKGSVNGGDNVNFCNLIPVMALKMKLKTNIESLRDIMSFNKIFK